MDKGQEGTSYFWEEKFWTSDCAHFIVDHGDAPPPPFITDGRHPERPPQRAVQPISSPDSGERSVAARWLWAALGLSSGRFASAAAAIFT